MEHITRLGTSVIDLRQIQSLAYTDNGATVHFFNGEIVTIRWRDSQEESEIKTALARFNIAPSV